MKKFLLISVLILFFLAFVPSSFSTAPTDTNADNFWVSEEASEFWVMNNPQGRIENQPVVFHYNSSYDLVEKIHPEETSRDFLRLEDDRWLGVDSDKIKIYDESWDITRDKRKNFESSLDGLRRVRKDGKELEALAEINESYYSYKINLENLKLENKSSETLIEPDEYTSGSDKWMRYERFLFKNKTELRKLGDNRTFENRIPVRSDDVQIENGSIFFLTDETPDYSEVGGKIYQYDLRLENEINSFDVGLNESQVEKSFSTNFIGIMLISGMIVLTIGFFSLIAIIYFVKKN